MASAFGWLDTDSHQRVGMLDVVDLFRERGTLDELGIGGIRDSLSNTLFPGTSTLHRRLRYVLFIPWLLQLASDRAKSADQMRTELRKLEVRLIQSLLDGGETEGVIGGVARAKLVTMPSAMYWSALGSWGLRQVDSVGGYYQRQRDRKALKNQTTEADDPGAREPLPAAGLDAYLPPAPPDLLTKATFDLTAQEADYLTHRITQATRGTALAWLVNNPAQPARYVWELGNLGAAPEQIRSEIDHARRFSLAIRGATILYYLLIAETAGRDSDQDVHRRQLTEWQDELAATQALIGWERSAWWQLIQRRNPRILRSPTQRFFDTWLELAAAPDDLANSASARQLITQRERQIKGTRAPLANQSALDRWPTGGNIGYHSFRWEIAQAHVQDLVEGRNRT